MTPRTHRFRFLIILASLVVLAVVADLLTRGVPTGRLRTLIEKNLTQTIGLPVTLSELDMALLPMPHLHAAGIRVANAPGRSTPDLLRVQHIEIRIELWPLLERRVVIDAIEIGGADLQFETDAEGGRPGKLDLGALVNDADEDAIQLELRHLELESLRVFYRDGRSGASHSLILDTAVIESKALGSEISIDVKGQFEGSPILLSGRVGSLHDLLDRKQPFPVDVRGQLFESHFEAKGTVQEPWTFGGLDLEINAEIPELVIEGHSLPQLGTVRFGGHLSDLDGSLGLERLRLDGSKTVPVRFAVTGKVDDLLGRKEVDVEIDVETSSLEFLRPLLEAQVDLPLPTIASLSAKLKLSNQEGRLDLDGTIDATTAGDPIEIHAKGGVRDLTGVPEIDAELDARATDLAAISSLIPEFPMHGPFGPLTASGRVRSHERGLSATDIAILAGSRKHAWVELAGNISDVVTLREADLEASFGAQSLHHLRELLRRELPQTSLFEGSAKLSDKDGSLGLEHVRLHGGDTNSVEIHLEARFDDLPKRDEIKVELDLSGQDTRVLGAIVGIDLPAIAPVNFRGDIEGSDERLEVENMTLRLGETRLNGKLSGSFAPHARPSVTARLQSNDVRLQDLGLTGLEIAPGKLGSGVADEKKGGVATADSGDLLPFETLRHFDLDLGVQFDHVGGYRGFDAKNAGFELRLKDGRLVVTDAGARYQDGALSATMQIDARTQQPRLEAELHTRNLNIATLMSQFDENSDHSGLVDAELELRARGDRLALLRRSLTGEVKAILRDGNAASRIGREFIVNLASIVFPSYLTRSRDAASIGCAVVDLEIENGIASVRSLVLRGDEVGVSGSGNVDLVQGRYDLYVVPKAMKPGLLSVAPSVRVRGPLDAPEFLPVKRTLVTSFGRGLIKNALGAGKFLLFPFGKRGEETGVSVKDCQVKGT